MKRFGMAVAALLMCATMSFAQKPSLSREPFVVSTEKLANYLQLSPDQYRKYVTLLNITNNNNRTLGVNTFPEVYLADNASK